MRSDRFQTPLLALALALWALPSLAQDWSGRGRLHGRVTDESDKPIAGAKVTLHSPADPAAGPAPVTTDKKGNWAYLGLVGGTWTVSVEAAGYVPAEGPWEVTEFGAGKLLVVKLKVFTPESAEAAAPKKSPVAEAVEKGNAFLTAGQPAEARAEYEKALAAVEDPPTQVILLRAIAQCYQAESAHDKAIATLERALTLAPDDSDAQKLLAISYYQSGQRDRAIALLKALFEKNPADGAVGQTLVSFLIETGNEAEADSYAARLPQGVKVDSASLLNIGIRHYNDGRLQEALAAFERVVAEYPDLVDGYYFRGLVKLGLNRAADAKADFRKVIELAPGSERAKEAAEFLKY